jgi:hypothetical protein
VKDAWLEKRLKELKAAPPGKRKKVAPFVKVPLRWITQAAKATQSPRTTILIELLYASWTAKSLTFALPNQRLKRRGASREIKRLVLRDLERARLITVERRPRKAPIVTLTLL